MKYSSLKPPKIANLKEAIHTSIKEGRYRSCLHLQQREKERTILRREVLHVLEHGSHEKKKDTFDEIYQSWRYAIRGRTLDERELRVIITFEEEIMMIIITTFEIGKEDGKKDS